MHLVKSKESIVARAHQDFIEENFFHWIIDAGGKLK